jgi:hypothetical protein
MTPAVALHTAARRYCQEQSKRWGEAYAPLAQAGQHLVNGQYTQAALDVFPRYRQLDAIRSDIERWNPDDFRDLAEARELLLTAGLDARAEGLERLHSPIADRATEEERLRFADYLRSLDEASLALIEPLPYRRVLAPSEAQERLALVEARFGAWYGGCRREQAGLPESVTLTASRLPEGYEADVRRLLTPSGHLWELCELDDSYEQDAELANFSYSSGGEAYWADQSLSWMVYASHEDTLTFAGAELVARLRRERPDWTALGRSP